ncbi:MAG TPA: hypothetical protein DEV81_18720 [Cyanobacteria bacterium UBA11049]|nr:hypothetical protein [Cyanobacteria bacterium UBA11049]
MSNNHELQIQDLNSISDQPETAQIYEELTEEALESVVGGKRYLATEGGVVLHNSYPSTGSHFATEGTVLHW